MFNIGSRKKNRLRVARTPQSDLIVTLLKRGGKNKIIDNGGATIKIMDRESRRIREFSRLDFRRARLVLGLGVEKANG